MTKTHEVKQLRPKDIDAKYLGDEPAFEYHSDLLKTEWELSRLFTWYAHFYDKTHAKDFLIQYLVLNGRKNEAELVKKVSDSQIRPTIGWLARISARGYKLADKHIEKINTDINRLISVIKPEITADTKVESNRPNVQEIMRERTTEVGGELEGIWDEYLKDGAKKDFKLNIVDLLSQRNIMPQHVSMLVADWQTKQKEYEAVLSCKDEQLNEAYNRFSKTQVKNILRYIEQLLADLNSYVSVKKAGKKPRAKKPVPVEKLVKKLKYLKAFKDENSKLDLVSIAPTKLHGSSEAWVYDTKKRKLYHYIADEYSKSLGVKGNTVIGFCTKESKIKTLRKPAEQLKEIMGSKPAARKFFKDIRAMEVTPNGKFNSNMIILRAF